MSRRKVVLRLDDLSIEEQDPDADSSPGLEVD